MCSYLNNIVAIDSGIFPLSIADKVKVDNGAMYLISASCSLDDEKNFGKTIDGSDYNKNSWIIEMGIGVEDFTDGLCYVDFYGDKHEYAIISPELKADIVKKMNLIRATYGEYDVPFDVARQMDCYKYGFGECSDINEVKEKFNEFSHDDIYIGGLVVLEFGNIDIELNSTGSIEEKNILDMITCIRTLPQTESDSGWITYEFTGTEITSIEQLDNLEKLMYDDLMRFAKEKDLKWSKLN